MKGETVWMTDNWLKSLIPNHSNFSKTTSNLKFMVIVNILSFMSEYFTFSFGFDFDENLPNIFNRAICCLTCRSNREELFKVLRVVYQYFQLVWDSDFSEDFWWWYWDGSNGQFQKKICLGHSFLKITMKLHIIFSRSSLEIRLFLINTWNFHMLFLQYLWKFHLIYVIYPLLA